jgi:hypothetical protein
MASMLMAAAAHGCDGVGELLCILLGAVHRTGRGRQVLRLDVGSIGASYLLQRAIVSFYDVRPQRRSETERIYPNIFIFHVGEDQGEHVMFDFFPQRKEVFVDNTPARILEAINDRGITRLAVPDRTRGLVQLPWKEPAEAMDRIVSVWAYSATGRVEGADVAVVAADERADANTRLTLDLDQNWHDQQAARMAGGDVTIPPDKYVPPRLPRRTEIGNDIRERILHDRANLDQPRGRIETYRRLDVRASLGMLHRGPAHTLH